LSICKTIFDLMNAEYGVESEIGKGSKFWFEILLKNPSKETILPDQDVYFNEVIFIHPDKIYSEYLNEMFLKMKMNSKISTNGNIEINLSDKKTLLLIEESLLNKIPKNMSIGEGSAFIIGNSVRDGFQNFNDPLSISHLFNVLTFQRDKRNSSSEQILTSNLRILIVDDNLMILKSLENLLKKLKLGIVDTASNGFEALELVKLESKYDIIFMDIQMPVKDGIEAVHELREMEDLEKSNTPVVALTGNSISNPKIEQCKMWKMEDILMKPINKNELLKCIQKNVSKNRKK
jgi:CheY-like chemotaxis protein